MIKIGLRQYNSTKSVDKGVLYRVDENTHIEFVERHEDTKTRDVVKVEYCLEQGQYGIYAYEYKRPGLEKDGCKVADVLACVVDENKKEIISLVFDVKRDISAFSDDLFKPNAMIIAIKEIRDFIKQIHDELLHKESFVLYYKADEYKETEKIGIATSSFEPEKFRNVAKLLEKLMTEDEEKVSDLIALKLKNNLKPYANLIIHLRNFADKKVIIGQKMYELNVYLLQKVNERDYETTVKVAGF